MWLSRRMGSVRALVLLLLSVGAMPSTAWGAAPPTRVSALTMGPGAHPFTRFGHNAILLEWDGDEQRRNAVYNFGTFAFDGPKGIADFMAGRFRYWLSVGNLESTVRSYGAAGRSLTLQELRLTAAERAQLADTLAHNALPANRYYDYDYYRDNCSTRVRDALDQLLGGRLAREVQGPGTFTFRQHTLRLLGDAPAIYAGLDLALGAPTDRPTTRWEELFLPPELHDALSVATRELDGQTVPLVSAERQLLSSSFRAAPKQPPERRPWFAAVGVLLGAAFAGLGLGARRWHSLRVSFGLYSALWGTVLGLLGCVFTWFWLLSKHTAAYQNHALLGCPPWALALAVLGMALALDRPGAAGRLRSVVTWGLLSSGLMLLFALFRADGEGLRLGLFFAPLWCGWLLGARWLSSSGHGGTGRHRAG